MGFETWSAVNKDKEYPGIDAEMRYNLEMKIEWDSRKAKSNMKKHGISFEEKESENSMKKDKDELRSSYTKPDFPDGLVRGKYAKQLKESSNIIVLRPEVAEVFTNAEAVNNALLSLIHVAQKTARSTKLPPGTSRKRALR